MSKAQTVDMKDKVQHAIDELVESGAERGLQVAVFRNGEQVVDAVAGIADPSTGREFTPATPVYCFSVVKAAASTLAHMLVERGAFGYETPVSKIWPEFAAHGKDRVTIRQVLNHTAGVPGIPLTTTLEDLCDWDEMCSGIAASELWWEPGTKVGYHAYTFGWIIGEVIRRSTGRPLSQVLRDEIGRPLGIEDELYFGMPAAAQHRLAVLEDAPMPAGFEMPPMPPDLPMFRAAPMSSMPNAYLGNRGDILAADIPAGGKCSARAIARMYAALLGEVDGVRLLSPATLREATSVSSSGVDEIFGMPTRWGLGYSIGAPGSTSDTAFGVGGVGGSFAFGDGTSGIAMAVTKNRLAQDFTTSTKLVALVTS